MKKSKKRTFEQNAKKAKEILASLRVSTLQRFAVVKLAKASCFMFYGGRVDEVVLTRKKFADAVGMKPHTLYEWIKVHDTVYVHLTDEQKELAHKSWMSLTNAKQRMYRARLEGKEHARSHFGDLDKDSDATMKIRKYVGHLNGLLFNAKNPRLLLSVPTQDLEAVKAKLEETAGLFDHEIKFRKKSGWKPTNEKYKTPTVTKSAIDKMIEEFKSEPVLPAGG